MIHLSALYNFIASELHTNIRVFETGFSSCQLYTKRIDLEDTFFHDTLEESILKLSSEETPYIIGIHDAFVYGTVKTDDFILIAGPVFLTDNTDLKYRLSDVSYPPDFPHQVFPCTLSFFMDHLLLVHNLFHEKRLSLHDSLNANHISQQIADAAYTQFSRLLFTNREYSQKHNPYEQELREMSSIESGDITQLKHSWEEEYSGSYGITSKDEARNGKNLAIIVVALATRAAIRGGLLPEIAFSLGDVYMQQIDATRNLFDIGAMTKNAEYTLTQMVAQNNSHFDGKEKQEINPVIERCKDYISSHLHDKITVQELADELNMHPNYLSSAFKKYEGISLYQYILAEKVALVKNFLIYSEYTFSEIATYLGFSSQSHLGRIFKKATGFTLQQFKNRYHKSEGWE